MNITLTPRSPLFSRTQGSGSVLVCLHSSSGSHAQWRGLTDALGGRCQTISPDLFGHGRSPDWPMGYANTLHVDAHGVSALMRAAASSLATRGIHLVGHSYGGAVAMQIALHHPRWVRSLTLYEPVPFGVMRSMAPADAALGEIEDIAHSVEAMVHRNELEGAARIFVGYWGGASAWEALGPAQRTAVAARIATVPRHFDALLRANWNPRVLSCLNMPILLIRGSNSRLPARRVSELLGHALPHIQRLEVAGAGHLGPMTHEPEVSARMLAFLEANAGLPQAAQTSEPALA